MSSPLLPTGVGAVRIPLPLGLPRGELCWASAAGLPPPTAPLCSLPAPLPAAGSYCCPQPLPRVLSEGWQSSAPSQVILAWTRASPLSRHPVLRESSDAAAAVCLCSRAARLGSARPPARFGLLDSLHTHTPSACSGRSNSVGKRCWDITMETESLHRAASVCMAMGCPHPLCLPACFSSDVAVTCFWDKGVVHSSGLLSMRPVKHWYRNSAPDFHLGCDL